MLPGTYLANCPMNMMRQASGSESFEPRSASRERQTIMLPMRATRLARNAKRRTGAESRCS